MVEAVRAACGYCCGVLGWSEAQFYNTSCGGIWAAQKARNAYDASQAELLLGMYRNYMATYINSHFEDRVTPQQIVRLSCDEPSEIEAAQLAAAQEEMETFMKRQ